MLIPLDILSPKLTTFRFVDDKTSLREHDQRLVSLRKVVIVVVVFFAEYAVAFVVGKNFVKIAASAAAANLASGVIDVIIVFVDVVFDDDYIAFCYAVDAVVAVVVVFVVDADVSAIAYVDVKYISNNL